MPGVVDTIANAPLDTNVARIVLSVALGLFLGLEREWSQKAAGIRTFALVSVLGTIFTLYEADRCATGDCVPVMAAMAGFFVISVAAILMYSGVISEDEGLHLTTAVSLMVAYGVGILVAIGDALSATVVAVMSSLLLVLKRELHSLAWGLSRKELRSATEFAIIAFVVYPILPPDAIPLGPPPFDVAIEPRVVWLMVVFVAGIGIVNYAVVENYGSRGIAVTGFFGGLASSTAVVGTMLDHVSQHEEAANYAVAGVLLANAAMAVRNLVIAIVFTLSGSTLYSAAIPLGTVILVSLGVAAYTADWNEYVPIDLESPFSTKNALAFGGMFLIVVVAGGIAEVQFGSAGLYVTALLSGLVSSAGATTSAVVLYRAGTIDANAATIAVLLATASSIGMKVALASTSSNRDFARRAALWSAVVLGAGGIAASLPI